MPFAFLIYNSKAPVIEGAFGKGASISRINPASRTAFAVVGRRRQSVCCFAELWEVYKQRIYTRRTEESNYVVKDFLQVGKVRSNGVINDGFGIIVSTLFQKIRDIILANIRAGEKIFFILVFLQNLQQILRSFQTGKDLPLADHNIFLKIVRRLLGDAKIFHLRRHLEFQFLANMEEVINRISACKDNRSVIQNINFLFRNSFTGTGST